MRLSPHFLLFELIFSNTAVRKNIDNTPDEIQIINLTELCKNVLEPLRAFLDAPVHISSGYRCPKLNKLIGGAKNSQHIEGKAADISVPGLTTEELFQIICNNFKFDQCIQEFDSWVHVSWNSPEANRNQKLRAVKVKQGRRFVTKYLPA